MARSPDSLHEHAVEAERHLEQLATGLAQAQADPRAVKAVTQCASIVRGIVKVLGSPDQNPPEADRSPESEPGEQAPEDAAADAAEQAGEEPRESLGQAAQSVAREESQRRRRPPA